MWTPHDDFALLTLRYFVQRRRVDNPRIATDKRHTQALLLGSVVRVAVGRRCGLGQPVTLSIVQAILFKQALRDCLRHGGAAATDVNQTGQVKLIEIWTRQQINHHGRDVRPVRDAPAADELTGQLAVPARHDHQRCAAVHRRMHHRHHAGDVEHWHDRQDDVRKVGAAPQACRNRVVHDAGVRMHATLRQAGGAAGVGQHSQVLRRGRMCRQISNAARQCVRPGHETHPFNGGQRVPGAQPVAPSLWHGCIEG